MSAFLTWRMEGAYSVSAELPSRFECVCFDLSVVAFTLPCLFKCPFLDLSSDRSKMCLSIASNPKNPESSLRYRASSAPRLGPETWTRISTGRVIARLHCLRVDVSARLGGLSISRDGECREMCSTRCSGAWIVIYQLEGRHFGSEIRSDL